MMNLLSIYYMMINRRNKSQYDCLISKKSFQLKFNFSHDSYKLVNDIVDSKFELVIKQCYHDFTTVAEPFLTHQEIQDLIDIFMMMMLGFDKKKVLSCHEHLNQSFYYDRPVFCQYLTQGHICSNQLFTHWEMVATASVYARGETNIDHNSYFGNSTCIATFMRKTKD